MFLVIFAKVNAVENFKSCNARKRWNWKFSNLNWK